MKYHQVFILISLIVLFAIISLATYSLETKRNKYEINDVYRKGDIFINLAIDSGEHICPVCQKDWYNKLLLYIQAIGGEKMENFDIEQNIGTTYLLWITPKEPELKKYLY